MCKLFDKEINELFEKKMNKLFEKKMNKLFDEEINELFDETEIENFKKTFAYLKYKSNSLELFKEGVRIGLEEARQKNVKLRKIEMAKKLLYKLSDEVIANVVNLTIEEVRYLREGNEILN